MLRILPLLYYLMFFSCLFLVLDISKKEVNYISIPFYALILIVNLFFQKKQVKKVVFIIINLTALFLFTSTLMKLFYKLFPSKREEFPLQTILEWQLVLSFIISLVLCILFYRKYNKTIKHSTNIFLLSTILLILVIDALML